MKLDLDRYVPGLILWVSNRLSSSAGKLYRTDFDIGVTDWRVLAFFELYPWSTASKACQLMGIDKAAVSRSTAALQEKRCIRSRPEGARKILFATTESGHSLYEAVYQAAAEREEALLSTFSTGERELLIEFLHRLLRNLPLLDGEGQGGEQND